MLASFALPLLPSGPPFCSSSPVASLVPTALPQPFVPVCLQSFATRLQKAISNQAWHAGHSGHAWRQRCLAETGGWSQEEVRGRNEVSIALGGVVRISG